MLRLPDPEVPGQESALGPPAESPPAAELPKPSRKQASGRSGAGKRPQRRARNATPLAAVPQPHTTDPDASQTQVEAPAVGATAVSNPLFKAIDGGLVDAAEDHGNRRRPVSSGAGARAAAAPRRRAARVRGSLDGGDDSRIRPECYACPVGLAFGTVRGASPETLDHLVSASRELVAAFRTVMESLEANLERRGRGGAVQRIGLD